MKKCPYGAEEVQDEATFRLHCGRDTRVPPPSPQQVTQGQQPASPTHANTAEPRIGAGRTLVVLLSLLGIMWVSSLGLVATIGSSLRVEDATAHAAILQLIVRVLVGTWAVKDRSHGRSLSAWKKAGFFSLAFVPIGALFALWYASRTLARTHFFGAFAAVDVAVTAIGALLVAPPLISNLPQTTSNQTYSVPTQPEVQYVAPTARVGTAKPAPVNSQQALPTAAQIYAPSCLATGEVSGLHKGRTLKTHGKILDEGTRDCPSCQYGKCSYPSLGGGFDIISHDWIFKPGWVAGYARYQTPSS